MELRTPEGQTISSCCFTNEAIEKAKKIYDRWDLLQRDPLKLEVLKIKIGFVLNPEVESRERYLEDILLLFKGLNASELEVFSILAIYEARLSKNPAWPLELLALAEKYTPDVIRGKKVLEGSKKSGSAHAAYIKEERGPIWKEWQDRAKKIWDKNPALAKLSVARIIAKETKKPKNTIRQRIFKPPKES